MTQNVSLKSKKGQIDYTCILFLTLTPIIAITSVIAYLHFRTPAWQTIILTIAMFFLVGLSITVGYHRLLSHRAFTANPIITAITLLFGAAAFENSALKWCRDHRDHHAQTDHKELDPYAISRGFFFAHMGWIFFKSDFNISTEKNISDLRNSKLVMLQHKYYLPLTILIGVILPSLLGLLWHDFWGALVFACLVRIVVVHHSTFFINSLAHMVGKRTYNKQISARDSFLISLISLGEGYHNYHHAYPYDYRNGRKAYNFDPSKWIIFLLSKVGLAKDLRRATQETRVTARKLVAEMVD